MQQAVWLHREQRILVPLHSGHRLVPPRSQIPTLLPANRHGPLPGLGVEFRLRAAARVAWAHHPSM